MSSIKKVLIGLVLMAVACGLLWFFYAPAHWMTRVDFATVRLDDRVVSADVYMGHPTNREAEAYVLVHTSAAGDYFLNFEDEGYRQVSGEVLLRTPWGAWTLKSMDHGPWKSPLPFLQMNEFRIAASDGRVVKISF
jgi:hypothetical protein